jgi:hypothetical protein
MPTRLRKPPKSKDGSPSFLKKRSKKLLDPGTRVPTGTRTKLQKFFGSFFQKRTCFLKAASSHNKEYKHG